MSTLRSLRLLGAVEAGTVSGSQLQTYLSDVGRASEFGVLLANRGQSRRIANSTVTMAAIVGAPAATSIIFQGATTLTNAACAAVVNSATAMTAVANSTASLNVVGGNSVAWGLYSTSPYYEANVRTTLALYAGVIPASYPTVDSLVSTPTSIAAIASSAYAMNAMVASATSTAIMAANSAAMALVANNAIAIDIVAKQTAIMSVIANSSLAMTEIVSRSTATAKMASYPGAILAISKVPSAWASYMAGSYFATNLPTVLANLIGVAPASYPTLDSIIADATALAKVAASTQAVQALASNSAAMTSLAGSANIGIILGSTTAMAVIGPNTTAMTSFLNASGAWAGLFASSVAKGYIVASTAMVNVISGNTALQTYLNTISKTAEATGIPDGNATSLQSFVAVPAMPTKILSLGAREVGIAATFSPYNFGGSSMAGANAGASLSLTGSVGVPATLHIAGYTNVSWNLQGVGVTAATRPIIIYVDMT